MSCLDKIKKKIYNLENIIIDVNIWRNDNKKIVFTNGCFDLIHKGHIDILSKSADLGDRLVVGVNSDLSIRNLKGESRPIMDQDSRLTILSSFEFIDAVILFDEETPYDLIKNIVPNILTKGGDYKAKNIVGSDIVLDNGGDVVLIPFVDGCSSTSLIDKILHNSNG